MQETLHNVLLMIKSPVDKGQSLEAERVFIQMRQMSPSDEFVQAIISEIINCPETSQLASVLLRKDIIKSDDESCICRLTNVQTGKQAMTQLLMHISMNPDDQLIQVISSYLHQCLVSNIIFDEALDFINQANASENAKVRRMSVYLVQLICEASVQTIQRLNFDFFGFLQKALVDLEDQVASCAISALCNIILNNRNAEQEPQIPLEIVQQVYIGIIQRISASFSTENKYSVKMMQAALRVLEYAVDDVAETIPTILEFISQIMQSQLSLELKRQAVLMFSALFNSKDTKKVHRTAIQQFISACIFPGLVPTDEEVNDFLNNNIMNDVEQLSLQEAARECLRDAGFILGKQVVFPLVLQLIEQAQAQDDFKIHLAAIQAIQCCEEMKEVLKQVDTDKLSHALLKFIQSAHPMTVSYALVATTTLAAELLPQLQKQHKLFVPALCQIINEQNEKLSTDASAALINFSSGLSYELTYKYQAQLINAVRVCLGRSMLNQANAMTLMHSMCEIMDPEDLHVILVEIMPQIFEQFGAAMKAILEVKDFTKDQIVFIESLVQLIANASSAVPELFKQSIELIAQNIVIIIQRSYQQEEHSLFANTLKALSFLQNDFSTQLAPFLENVYEIFISVLSGDITEHKTDLQHENEIVIKNPHLEVQQRNVLSIMSTYIEKYPQGLMQHFIEIYDVITVFEPINEDQSYSWLHCMCVLLRLAVAANQDYTQVHKTLFHEIYTQFYPEENQSDVRISLTNTKQCADAADAFFFYLKYYLQQQILNPDPNYYETENKFFQILGRIQEKLNMNTKIFIQEHAERQDDLGQEEFMSALQQLYTEYSECMEQLGFCYSQFITVFKGQVPLELLKRVNEIAVNWIEQGTDTTPACYMTLEAIGIYADIAHFVQADYVQNMFESALPWIFQALQNKDDDFALISVSFYCLFEYVNRTLDVNVASNAELLNLAAKYLESSKEDGQVDSLNAYDNICSYLTVSGQVSNQQISYWAALVEKCSFMEGDEYEITRVLDFFTKHFNQFTEIKYQVLKMMVNLFFGQFYSKIKNDAENGPFLALIKQLFQKEREGIVQIIQNGSDFEKKNSAAFGIL
ncbi:Importin_beta-3 subunit [Hexamita inflata]|uniref:Importin beta-3 subunit n=1 Tax=Hexamita inflata TaxID=28002 RepID=A0AA86RC59_9EUKA|nr:Importin beta-3 subunit [Hexamita inflata]